MKMPASQIAAMLGFEIKPWMAFEKVDGKTVSKLDESKLGLRRGYHVPQDRYLAQLTAFCKLTGLTPASEITKGGMFYWVAFDKAALEAVSLDMLNLPVTVLQSTSKPAPIVDEEEIIKASHLDFPDQQNLDDEDEDSDDEEDEEDYDDEDEDGEDATA